jgi:hypothetical protein
MLASEEACLRVLCKAFGVFDAEGTSQMFAGFARQDAQQLIR